MFVGPGTKRKWRPGRPLREWGLDISRILHNGSGPPSEVLAALYRAGVEAAAPAPALTAALEAAVPDPPDSVWVVAVGKAAYPMADAALAHLAARGMEPAGGVVVGPEVPDSPPPGLVALAGDHPFPGPRSAAAVRELAGVAALASRGREVWVLLSGGATSLAASPAPGIDPSDFESLCRSLLTSGLDIAGMNTVRKRFSTWGAGRLAVLLAPAKVRTFAVSDVPGDDPAAIGSGPTVGDPATAGQVRQLLAAAGLGGSLPASVERHLAAVERDPALETVKPGHPALRGAELHLIAGNRTSVEAVARRAAALGYRPLVVDETLSGEASAAGRSLARLLLEQEPGTCLVGGGETVVSIPSGAGGSGGRCQELALAAASALAGAGGACLLAAGTDGRDGPTDAAGAVVDGTTWAAVAASGRDPAADLAGHDSYPALEAAGALLRTGLTGTNVMDLVIGLRY